MFRIECFCDDKKLAQVLNALQGLILADPRITPVVNAKAGNGTIKATSGGSSLELFEQYLAASKVKEFGSSFVSDFLRQHGKSTKSASYILISATKHGLIRLKGKGKGPGKPNTYVVREAK